MPWEADAASRLLRSTFLTFLVLALAVPAGLAAGLGFPDASPDPDEPAECASATSALTLALAVAAAFADEPGFVDAFPVSEDPLAVTALFDADARGLAPLPVVPAFVQGGHAVSVVADRFVPLLAPPAEEAGGEPPTAPVVRQIPQPCSGIRPGAGISTPVGGCSANFVFADQHGDTYVGTAGHCFSAVGQRMRVAGQEVGTNVWSVNRGIGNDFALVKIDADKLHLVNPAMCHWGGPTEALNGNANILGEVVRHHGNGVGYGTTQYTEPRSGAGWFGGATSSFNMVGQVASGDSGSGARLDDGSALGVLTHVNAGAVIVGHSAPTAYGTTIHRAIALVEEATDLELTLVTAPVTR